MIDFNCRWVEGILAVAILVFTWWPTAIFSAVASKWIVLVSAALLLVHALGCRKCGGICCGMMVDKDSKTKKKR